MDCIPRSLSRSLDNSLQERVFLFLPSGSFITSNLPVSPGDTCASFGGFFPPAPRHRSGLASLPVVTSLQCIYNVSKAPRRIAEILPRIFSAKAVLFASGSLCWAGAFLQLLPRWPQASWPFPSLPGLKSGTSDKILFWSYPGLIIHTLSLPFLLLAPASVAQMVRHPKLWREFRWKWRTTEDLSWRGEVKPGLFGELQGAQSLLPRQGSWAEPYVNLLWGHPSKMQWMEKGVWMVRTSFLLFLCLPPCFSLGSWASLALHGTKQVGSWISLGWGSSGEAGS